MSHRALSPQQFGDWRDQPIMVEGKSRRLGDVHGGALYHGSHVEFAPGEVLEPGHSHNFEESAKQSLSITSDPKTARYWSQAAGHPTSHVYEVEPLGKVSPWRVGPANFGKNIALHEGRVSKARVLKAHHFEPEER